jgi:hypothetical protein
MDVGPSEAEPFWTEFLRKLARRGLRGIKLVISDAHEGVKAAVAKVLGEPPKAVPAVGAIGAVPAPPTDALDPSGLYAAAWKLAIATANQTGRTNAFRAAQEGAEQKAPHDGSGIVGSAGVAAGGIFMRDAIPIEQVLLLYEPFAAAFPYESLV